MHLNAAMFITGTVQVVAEIHKIHPDLGLCKALAERQKIMLLYRTELMYHV